MVSFKFNFWKILITKNVINLKINDVPKEDKPPEEQFDSGKDQNQIN